MNRHVVVAGVGLMILGACSIINAPEELQTGSGGEGNSGATGNAGGKNGTSRAKNGAGGDTTSAGADTGTGMAGCGAECAEGGAPPIGCGCGRSTGPRPG